MSPLRMIMVCAVILPALSVSFIIKSKNDDFQAMEQNYKDMIAPLRSENKKLKSAQTAIEKQCGAEISTCYETLSSELEGRHETITDLQTAVSEKQQQINNLNKSINEVTASSKRETHKLEKEINDLNQQISDMKKESKVSDFAKTSEIKTYKQKINELNTQMDGLIASKVDEATKESRLNINKMLALVDSLPNAEDSKSIPLISNITSKDFQRLICTSEDQMSNTDLIAAKNIERFWFTWPVDVIGTDNSVLTAKTQEGKTIFASWHEPKNAYEIQEGDTINLQFKLSINQKCNKAVDAIDAIISPNNISR